MVTPWGLAVCKPLCTSGAPYGASLTPSRRSGCSQSAYTLCIERKRYPRPGDAYPPPFEGHPAAKDPLREHTGKCPVESVASLQNRPQSLIGQRFPLPRNHLWHALHSVAPPHGLPPQTVACPWFPFSLLSFSFSLILKGKKKRKGYGRQTGQKASCGKTVAFGPKPWHAFPYKSKG